MTTDCSHAGLRSLGFSRGRAGEVRTIRFGNGAVFGVAVSSVLLAALAGCNTPSAANIKLRQENQELKDKIARQDALLEDQRRTLRTMESKATTVPVLPSDRLEQLFTAHDLKFGRLTGLADIGIVPGQLAAKVYVTPVDASGQNLKSAGAFKVDVFDLAQADEALLGSRSFTIDEAKSLWHGEALLYGYVLTVPLNRAPKSNELSIRVSFDDALTQRNLVQTKQVKITLPTTTQSP